MENPRNTILTSPITMAEIISKFLRSRRDPGPAITALENNSRITPTDSLIARLAGEIHAEEKVRQPDFGLADAFVLATARRNTSKILTGDKHFKGFPEAVML